MIRLSYGGFFHEHILVDHMRKHKMSHIIQGQQKCARADHTKPSSLDWWLRQFARNPDTKQADNRVVGDLENTGLFRVSFGLLCPDNPPRRLKGLVLLNP